MMRSSTNLLLFLLFLTHTSAAADNKSARPAPDAKPTGTLVVTVAKGDTPLTMARHFLSQTSYMTVAELDHEIRVTNHLGEKDTPKPGDRLTIPGIVPLPWVEHARDDAKDVDIRAIYFTGATAGSASGITKLQHWHELGGNAVVFDIKDSDGSLSINFDHPLAPKTKSPRISNLPKYVHYIHSLGMHAIARIALFRDEQLVTHHNELAVQSRKNKEPWRENGKLVWTDSSNPTVQDYNIALAKYVAGSGVDEIQFDYVRFPAEGDQHDAVFHYQQPDKDGKPSTLERKDVIAGFLERAYGELHPLGVLLSIDVFGVMAWQRHVDLASTGQDIPAMARHCDVMSPMIYPSHFFGMDGYDRPGDAPEHFISISMERFRKVTAGTGAVLRPWLQAFGWRTHTYSPEYIKIQVATARNNGGTGYLFWNANNDYSVPYKAMPEMMSGVKTETAHTSAEPEEKPVAKPAPRKIERYPQHALRSSAGTHARAEDEIPK